MKQIVVRLAEEDARVVEAVMKSQGGVSLSSAVRYIIRQYASEHGLLAGSPKKKR